MNIELDYKKAKNILLDSKHLVVFTGAGISVESGIPPFTGQGGLWTQYDPKFIELSYFYAYPENSWQEIYKIFYQFMDQAKPNLAHITIGEWSKKGLVKAVITQNIDNLHQDGGANNVIEFHGTTKTLVCPKCGAKYKATKDILSYIPPKCPKCGSILKPDFVFYGEQINPDVHNKAFDEAVRADVMLIIGTSGQVMPANSIPYLAKQENKDLIIIEVNPKKSTFTDAIVDYYFPVKATEFFENIK